MGLICATLVAQWLLHLVRDTSHVLLDRQQTSLEDAIRDAIEDRDARISDLHVWSIGPDIHVAIVAVVAHDPERPGVYKGAYTSELPLGCPRDGRAQPVPRG